MKSKILSTLTYSGVVTLSKYTGSKKVELAQLHNEGSNMLFDFFTDCLAGNFEDAEAERPNKIRVINREKVADGVYQYTAASASFIHLVGIPEKLEGKSGIRYSFIIPKDLINNIESTGAGELALGLYAKKILRDDSDLKNFSAICDITSVRSLFNASNSALVVDWELTISNREPAKK